MQFLKYFSTKSGTKDEPNFPNNFTLLKNWPTVHCRIALDCICPWIPIVGSGWPTSRPLSSFELCLIPGLGLGFFLCYHRQTVSCEKTVGLILKFDQVHWMLPFTGVGIDFNSDIKHGKLFARWDYSSQLLFRPCTWNIKGVLDKNFNFAILVINHIVQCHDQGNVH